MNTTNIFVKITKVPGGVQEVSLIHEATVADALRASGFSASGFSITVNGATATESTTLRDGDRVILAQAVKSANGIFVKVTKVPGGVQEVSLVHEATVSDALLQAGFSASGFSITVNGATATESTTLRDGDRVILAQAVKSAN